MARSIFREISRGYGRLPVRRACEIDQAVLHRLRQRNRVNNAACAVRVSGHTPQVLVRHLFEGSLAYAAQPTGSVATAGSVFHERRVHFDGSRWNFLATSHHPSGRWRFAFRSYGVPPGKRRDERRLRTRFVTCATAGCKRAQADRG